MYFGLYRIWSSIIILTYTYLSKVMLPLGLCIVYPVMVTKINTPKLYTSALVDRRPVWCTSGAIYPLSHIAGISLDHNYKLRELWVKNIHCKDKLMYLGNFSPKTIRSWLPQKIGTLSGCPITNAIFYYLGDVNSLQDFSKFIITKGYHTYIFLIFTFLQLCLELKILAYLIWTVTELKTIFNCGHDLKHFRCFSFTNTEWPKWSLGLHHNCDILGLNTTLQPCTNGTNQKANWFHNLCCWKTRRK